MPYKDPEVRREYNRLYQKKHYQENKEYYKAKAKISKGNQRTLNRAFVNRVKQMYGCIDCGELDPIVLDFDHVRGEKLNNIADMVHKAFSIQTIKEEIRKCEIRCSNCHRKKTHERRNK
tara:strand:- start:742 stop:1098 length:357 start_codon:yes stop_codon:yes gene_type:complete